MTMCEGKTPATAALGKPWKFGLATLAAVALVSPLSAHHSFAMFDQTKTVKLSGKITKFDWENPHSWLRVGVTEGGQTVDYALEMRNPAGLVKTGIKKSTFKPGDSVVVFMHPLRDGSKGGSFMRAVLSNGSTVGTAPGEGE